MIFYECFADESLLKHFGFTSGDLRGGHSNGRSRVSAKLRNTSGAVGLIDEDPGAPKDDYLKYLFGLKPLYSDRYLIVINDSRTNNKLVVLRPNLEAWCVALAKDRNINLEDYDLANTWQKLHDILRIERNDRKRERFIEFITYISTHPSIVKLREFLD